MAFEAFRIARQGMIKAEQDGFPVDPLEKTYRLLSMAEAKLDLPKFQAGQNRFVITEEDMNSAEQLLNRAEIEAFECGTPSARFQSRKLITVAGLHFRQYQYDSLQDTHLWRDDKLSSQPQGCLKQSLEALSKAIALIKHTSFADLKIAKSFYQQMKCYNSKIDRRLDVTSNMLTTDEEAVFSPCSETDEQAYMNDLGRAEHMSSGSHESDIY